MSGDVFGNGMLLSPHIRLVAAFDHRHVFVDPTPDAARGFAERAAAVRAAALVVGRLRPRRDQRGRRGVAADGEVGAGRRRRSARRWGSTEDVTRLSPPELIRAILRAPADLLWNGGIGTYVKASERDPRRRRATRPTTRSGPIGRELRVKVVGEGGNLGLTQRGRIEFARNGGKINTDAIDNSAGVDCSDHEVNIKILLDRLVVEGVLDRDARNALLVEMTDEVAELVLADNRDQNAAAGRRPGARAGHGPGAPAVRRGPRDPPRQLDRQLEVLPDNAGFARAGGGGAGADRRRAADARRAREARPARPRARLRPARHGRRSRAGCPSTSRARCASGSPRRSPSTRCAGRSSRRCWSTRSSTPRA